MKPATIHKARVEHKCSDCQQPITTGNQYVKTTYPRIHGGSPEFTPPDFYHYPQCRDQQYSRVNTDGCPKHGRMMPCSQCNHEDLERRRAEYRSREGIDFGGAFDGFTVSSDADSGL